MTSLSSPLCQHVKYRDLTKNLARKSAISKASKRPKKFRKKCLMNYNPTMDMGLRFNDIFLLVNSAKQMLDLLATSYMK